MLTTQSTTHLFLRDGAEEKQRGEKKTDGERRGGVEKGDHRDKEICNAKTGSLLMIQTPLEGALSTGRGGERDGGAMLRAYVSLFFRRRSNISQLLLLYVVVNHGQKVLPCGCPNCQRCLRFHYALYGRTEVV